METVTFLTIITFTVDISKRIMAYLHSFTTTEVVYEKRRNQNHEPQKQIALRSMRYHQRTPENASKRFFASPFIVPPLTNGSIEMPPRAANLPTTSMYFGFRSFVRSL